jgi:hypothetical protein
MAARWHIVAEDRDMITVHIALWNDHAITLTAWKDDRAVMLWRAGDGREFADETFISFRAWLNDAQGRGQRR